MSVLQASSGWLPTRVLEPSPLHEGDEAGAYDDMVCRHGWLFTRPFVRLLSGLGLKRARVLDIGAGPGWIPIELARRHASWRIWAVDASTDMVERARRHAAEAGVADRVCCLAGQASVLPFAAGEFDLVISHFTLHHLAQPQELFDEAARVVRRGGWVVIKDLRRQLGWKARLLLAFARHVMRYNSLELQMYRDSLAAALTIEEVRAALADSRLAGARVRRCRGLDFVITARTDL